MKLNRKKLRKIILNEIHRLNESLSAVAWKVQELLDYNGHQYEVKEVPYMSGGLNPFDEFDDIVIGTLKKSRMYHDNVFYIDTGKDFRAVDEIFSDVVSVAGERNVMHSSSGGFLGRTIFFRG